MEKIAPFKELTVGVIGGMGPQATIDFLQKLINATPVQIEQDHLHVLLDVNPKVSDRNIAIRNRKIGDPLEKNSPGTTLAQMGLRLEAAGADFLVMACNTAHAFQPDIKRAVKIPFVSIVDEACDFLHSRAGPAIRVGILAAQGCVASGLYQKALLERGIGAIVLGPDLQADFMDTLYRIKLGDLSPEVATKMRDLALSLVANGASEIVAACTEVPLVLSENSLTEHLRHPVLDATAHLASRCVAYARGHEPIPAHCFTKMEEI